MGQTSITCHRTGHGENTASLLGHSYQRRVAWSQSPRNPNLRTFYSTTGLDTPEVSRPWKLRKDRGSAPDWTWTNGDKRSTWPWTGSFHCDGLYGETRTSLRIRRQGSVSAKPQVVVAVPCYTGERPAYSKHTLKCSWVTGLHMGNSLSDGSRTV